MNKTGLEAGMKINSKLFTNSVGKSLCHQPLLCCKILSMENFINFPKPIKLNVDGVANKIYMC